MLDPNTDNTQPTRPDADVEETRPVSTSPEPPLPGQPPASAMDAAPTEPLPPSKRVRHWPWVVGGIVLVLLCGALGGVLGYHTALKVRAQVSAEQITTVATEQFMLGLQEQSSGQLDLALKRFQYVIQLDPNFPGAQEKLTEVMMAVALLQTPSPTAPQATPTLTPTPDTRAEEEIFNNARDLVANKQWAEALDMLDTLRNKNLTYRAVQVDGLYYTALRFRGLTKINAGNLEGGLYDLALVEKFAPLDVDADGVRTWARMYIAGAAYWGVRWDQVILYFSQIYPYYPSMRDATGMTATERYRIALMSYGDQLASEGKYCEAVEQYDASYQVGPDGSLGPTATAVYDECHGSEPTKTQAPDATATPEPTTAIVPTATPSSSGSTSTPAPTSEAPTAEPTEAPQPTSEPIGETLMP
jgi:tetratricopeptide (TPR) repeat protein